MIMNLDSNSKMLISLLLDNGYQAYAVGGCVRDDIMGIAPKDVDITTSALPEEIETVLSKNDIKFVETGIKHGTVSAIVDHIPYEITTFRCDGDYLDNRHPENVEFVKNVKLDLARRDFTMNAIAYNDKEGIVDAFDGVEDINAKIIRAVGDADRRFQEDALRIMRAIRFSSVLGFEIEENTKKAIFNNKELLLNIAKERIFVELTKLLCGDNCENVLMEYRDVIAVIIPELKASFGCVQNSKWHLYDVYTHTVKSIAFCPKNANIRLTMLLHDIAKPYVKTTDEYGTDHFKGHQRLGAEMVYDILKGFKVSNDILNRVHRLVRVHDKHIYDNPQSIKHWLKDLGDELIFDFVDVKLADLSSHNLQYAGDEFELLKSIKPSIIKVINSNEPYMTSQLDINGFDLINIGYKGSAISKELEALLDFVIKNPSQNKKEVLLDIAKKDIHI